jgi:hypothetical protein
VGDDEYVECGGPSNAEDEHIAAEYMDIGFDDDSLGL